MLLNEINNAVKLKENEFDPSYVPPHILEELEADLRKLLADTNNALSPHEAAMMVIQNAELAGTEDDDDAMIKIANQLVKAVGV